MNQVILFVEDDAFNTAITKRLLEKNNYHVMAVQNGKEALDYLRDPSNRADIILLDYFMPVMDGLTFMNEYNQGHFSKHVPVIMITGTTSSVDIEKAIKSGIYYYLNKPIQENILLSLIEQATVNYKKHCELREIASQQYDLKAMLRTISLEGKSFGEMRSISRFLSGFYPDPQKAIVGIYEMLVNAVEHGSMEIDFTLKKQLLDNMCWDQEINKRQSISPYKERSIKIHFSIDKTQNILSIEDEGQGFDFHYILSHLSRSANEHNGRGILIAKELSFDSVEYIGKGNKVVCIKYL